LTPPKVTPNFGSFTPGSLLLDGTGEVPTAKTGIFKPHHRISFVSRMQPLTMIPSHWFPSAIFAISPPISAHLREPPPSMTNTRSRPLSFVSVSRTSGLFSKHLICFWTHREEEEEEDKKEEEGEEERYQSKERVSRCERNNAGHKLEEEDDEEDEQQQQQQQQQPEGKKKYLTNSLTVVISPRKNAVRSNAPEYGFNKPNSTTSNATLSSFCIWSTTVILE
jgi:hypothetical protein